MTKLKVLSSITVLIALLSLSGCMGGVIDIYEKTGIQFDGKDVVTFTEDYKKSDNYKKFKDTCNGTRDVFVAEIDGTGYYYTSEYCYTAETIKSLNLVEFLKLVQLQEYMIYTSPDGGLDDPRNVETFGIYISNYMDEPVTDEDLKELDFIFTKDTNYTPTGKTIQVGYSTYDIYSYSDKYMEENTACMKEFQKVIYEDDIYKYIYTYQSCEEDSTQHIVNQSGAVLDYQDIDDFIADKRDYLTWCDIVGTGLGEKVPKDPSLINGSYETSTTSSVVCSS